LHQNRFDFPVGVRLKRPSGSRRARIFVVDEIDAVTDEYLVFNGHTLADECMAGYFAVAADPGAFLDLDKRTYAAVVSNLTAV
jgi:hypothetical protein